MVNVINKTGEALSPCTEAKARHLLDERKAEIVTKVPFTIRLNFAVNSNVAPEKESATSETAKRKTVEVDGKTVIIPKFYEQKHPEVFKQELKEMREKYTNRFCCKPARTREIESPLWFCQNSIRGRKFTIGKSVELGRFPEKDEELAIKCLYNRYPTEWEGLAGQPVKWRVLDVDRRNNAILLFSENILFYDSINDKHKRRLEGIENELFYRWTESDICMYLNTDFLKDFSLSSLPFANVLHETEPGWFYKTEPAEYSEEKVFLLSKTEVEKYLPKTKDRIAKNASGSRDYCYEDYWLLRTPGNKYNPELISDTFEKRGISGPTLVSRTGEIEASTSLRMVGFGIRPAFWLRIV